MRALPTALCALLLSGCGHLYRKHTIVMRSTAVATDNELICYQLDNTQIALGAVAIVFGAVSGGASTVIAIVDDRKAQYGLIGGSLGATLVSVLSGYLQGVYVKRFKNHGCN